MNTSPRKQQVRPCRKSLPSTPRRKGTCECNMLTDNLPYRKHCCYLAYRNCIESWPSLDGERQDWTACGGQVRVYAATSGASAGGGAFEPVVQGCPRCTFPVCAIDLHLLSTDEGCRGQQGT